MFDFLDSDWFIITLEIVFIVLIAYDVKQYIATKKKEYITNIVLTLGFAIWVLYPMYIKYFGWEESQREVLTKECRGEDNTTKLCKCISENTFKTYTYGEYSKKDKDSKEYQEFIKETKEDCLDDSWF